VFFDLAMLGRGYLVVNIGRHELAQSSVFSICQEPDQFFFPLNSLC